MFLAVAIDYRDEGILFAAEVKIKRATSYASGLNDVGDRRRPVAFSGEDSRSRNQQLLTALIPGSNRAIRPCGLHDGRLFYLSAPALYLLALDDRYEDFDSRRATTASFR